MNKIYYLVILIFISVSTFSCGRFGNKEKEQTENKTTDSTNVEGNKNQERIVSLSKQYNEIIYALNAEKNIVAVDLSSTYPPEIKNIQTVGYHRALSAEAILSMKPTLILEDNNIGPEHVVTQLKDLQIPMKQFGKYEHTIAGTDSLIREMGIYFNASQKAEELCKKLDEDMEKAKQEIANYKTIPKVLVIHFGRASNVYLVMTKKSTAAKMIEWAGGTMAVEDQKGMKQFSPEVVAQADPDIILLTDFGYDRLGSTQKISELAGISTTKAFKNNQIYRVEEHDMVYLGPRTGENILLLQKLIHQDAKK
ncbi:ABC transporter substrate-binding protein [Bernardetia sp. Wsw4-3y2]|uniref:heme/hemin ABC transporter substrate-binding protein n=1 Tax=Bernardetia sp. Wsw4-3y2 TaxID=3127471 RepID=UPI0030D41ED4